MGNIVGEILVSFFLAHVTLKGYAATENGNWQVAIMSTAIFISALALLLFFFLAPSPQEVGFPAKSLEDEEKDRQREAMEQPFEYNDSNANPAEERLLESTTEPSLLEDMQNLDIGVNSPGQVLAHYSVLFLIILD